LEPRAMLMGNANLDIVPIRSLVIMKLHHLYSSTSSADRATQVCGQSWFWGSVSTSNFS
jgi:hypothetical protein